MRKSRGFTLIEVLVVVSIIGLLVSITMPAFREARRLSRKTVCQKNLASIGLGMHAYLLTHRDTFPWACRLPSYEQTAADDAVPPRQPWVSLVEALKTEMAGKSEVYLCPADLNTKMETVIPTRRYYDNEGLSYEWESKLNGMHLSFKHLSLFYDLLKVKPSDQRMLSDFEPFHGGDLRRGSLNCLYVDLHVQSDNWSPGSIIGGVTLP